MSKRESSTDKIELVETQNLYASLRRLSESAQYDSNRWKRAVYHAVGMAGFGSDQAKKIREALDLP